MPHETREAWYLAAVRQIEQKIFEPAGYELPKFRIGCGWPCTGKAKTEAECFSQECSDDKTYEIFITPRLTDILHILEMLVHELCHTIAGLKAGHKKPFIEVMQTVGMIRPWKQSCAGEDLIPKLDMIHGKLGPYPHASLTIKKKEGQKGSRLLKVKCPECEYVARVTRKWLDEAGPPLCPVHKVAFKEEKPKDK